MRDDWARPLARWAEAGVVDQETAERIRLFEADRTEPTGLGWPVWLALAFGALMLGAAVLLFVSAHWDTFSPFGRFGVLLLLVAGFHIAAAAFSDSFPALGVVLHALGTVALGAGIYLAGQVFNLDEHWPGGVMLWALGAATAWGVLRDWPQLALLAVLAPAWLASEWLVATETMSHSLAGKVPSAGIFLLALAYVTSVGSGHANVRRRVLLWLGGLSLPVAGAVLAALSSESYDATASAVPNGLLACGWAVALGLPLLLAASLRRRAAWPNAVATCWVLVIVATPPAGDFGLWRYAWWALGAAALAAWGVADARGERVNMGAAGFALTVLTFYFSTVMDKLGRAESLAGLGALFLVGGVALERTRRRMIVEARRGQR
jgi:uncharacterized membrane protein